MYIFELIYKLINNKKNKKPAPDFDSGEEYEKCEHIFVPVDSTKKVLACSKCGAVKKISS